jgi:hypothetical protein
LELRRADSNESAKGPREVTRIPKSGVQRGIEHATLRMVKALFGALNLS